MLRLEPRPIFNDATTRLHQRYWEQKELRQKGLPRSFPSLPELRALVKEGAMLDLANHSTGLTPLMIATTCGSPHDIRTLIKAGALVDAQAPSGKTALDWAVESQNLPAMETLIASGGDVHRAYDSLGHNALHHLARQTRICIDDVGAACQMLVTAGANPNARNRTAGNTPCDLACEKLSWRRQYPLVDAMVQAGARLHPYPALMNNEAYQNLYHTQQEQAAQLVTRITADPKQVASWISAADCCTLSNMGQMDVAFHPTIWQSQGERLTSLLAELPPYLADEIISRHHGMIPPSPCIDHAEYNGMMLANRSQTR